MSFFQLKADLVTTPALSLSHTRKTTTITFIYLFLFQEILKFYTNELCDLGEREKVRELTNKRKREIEEEFEEGMYQWVGF